MYKTKMAEWDFKKNYTAAETEYLARNFKAYCDSGGSIPPLMLRNRPAKLGRIRRFCKQEKMLEEICDALKSDSPSKGSANLSAKAPSGDYGAATTQVIRAAINGAQNSSPSSVRGLTQTLFDPERPYSTASNIGRVELILLQTKIYLQSRLGSETPSHTQNAATQLLFRNGGDDERTLYFIARWIEKLSYGVGALVQQKPAQGWRMINEACEMVHEVLEQQPENLFILLLYGFSDGDWAVFPGLSTYLLRFFTKVSAGKLGCNHPISVVLYHLQEQQVFAEVTSPVFEVLMDEFGESLGPTNFESWALRYYYCNVLGEQGEYAAAESHGLCFLKQSEEAFGRLHWRTRGLLLNLADIHFLEEQYDLAKLEFQDVVQRGREDLGDEFPDTGCIIALRQLALIYEVPGDFSRSEEYWRAALTGAISEWGMEDEATTYIIIQLEESFKNQSMDPEAWLQQNFGISCI